MWSQECGAVRLEYAMPVCVLSVSSRSGIVFNPSASAISDYSQFPKDIDPYFKSQLYAIYTVVYTTIYIVVYTTIYIVVYVT